MIPGDVFGLSQVGSGGEKPEMLLNNLQYAGQPLKSRNDLTPDGSSAGSSTPDPGSEAPALCPSSRLRFHHELSILPEGACSPGAATPQGSALLTGSQLSFADPPPRQRAGTWAAGLSAGPAAPADSDSVRHPSGPRSAGAGAPWAEPGVSPVSDEETGIWHRPLSRGEPADHFTCLNSLSLGLL